MRETPRWCIGSRGLGVVLVLGVVLGVVAGVGVMLAPRGVLVLNA
ncbi:hypothetical protein [Corynebacterium macclintockiae]